MRWLVTGFVACAMPLAFSPTAFALWPEYGALISDPGMATGRGDAIPDGSGGIILVYEGYVAGTGWNIYAKGIDAWGRPAWDYGVVAICVKEGDQTWGQLTSDGAGGAFIAWDDRRGADKDVYAQHINSEGRTQWAANGVAVSALGENQEMVDLLADGAGGVILAWRDCRASSNPDIYAARLDQNGSSMWHQNGVAVCQESGNQHRPVLVTDGAGGVICVWEDFRQGYYSDVYAQRILPDGTMDWTENGVVVSEADDFQSEARAVSDQAGGAIIVWHDSRALDEYDIYAQRINGSGQSYWTADGIPICTADQDQIAPCLIESDSFGAIFAWIDKRTDSYGDVYAQKIDGYGNAIWPSDGVAVCTAAREQSQLAIATNDNGGALLSWTDERVLSVDQIFTQMLDAAGTPQFTPDGLTPFSPLYDQQRSYIVPDAAGGAFVAGECDIDVNSMFLQRIDRHGLWGYPSPYIAGADDVPGDQGGFVDLAFDASRLDPWPEEQISFYTIWRAIEGSAIPHRVEMESWLALVSNPPQQPIYRQSHSGSRAYYWELVASLDAYHLPAYSYAVPTLFDSTAVNQDYHYFQVIAHGTEPAEYWISPPDSGYSVDNLAPGAPPLLTGEHQNGDNLLYWLPSNVHAEDLDHYRIYASDMSGFPPAPEYVIGVTADTAFVETGVASTRYYLVSGVDIHGNEGEASEELEIAVASAAPEAGVIEGLHFAADRNPTARGSTLRLELPYATHVSLKIYTAAGRCVGELNDGMLPAGTHEFRWDDGDRNGGVFFAHLRAGSEERIVRLVDVR